MFSKIKDKLAKPNKATGIEIILLPDNGYKIYSINLAVVKNKIEILQRQEYASLEELKTAIDKNTPIALVINGRGILHKQIPGQETEPVRLLQAVLPNTNVRDFYVQVIPSETSTSVTIVRKEAADALINIIQLSNGYCIDVSLGEAAKNALTAFLQNTPLDNIEEKFYNAYASAFSILIGYETAPPFVEKVKENKEEFYHKSIFAKLSWSTLIVFFSVLLINFLLFTNFSSKNNELAQKERQFGSLISELESLNREVKEKETFLMNAGWLSPSSMSYYADRIAATVPSSVKLTELSVYPLDERKSREEKKECFTPGIILLKGDCSRPTELNEWLEKIKKVSKTKKEKLVHYAFDNKDNIGSFSIEIETAN